MPRYFFQFSDLESRETDEEAVEFDDILRARREAVRVLLLVAADEAGEAPWSNRLAVTVLDATRRPVWHAVLSIEASET